MENDQCLGTIAIHDIRCITKYLSFPHKPLHVIVHWLAKFKKPHFLSFGQVLLLRPLIPPPISWTRALYYLFIWFKKKLVILYQAIPLNGYLVDIPRPKIHYIHAFGQNQFLCGGSIYKSHKRRLIWIMPPIPLNLSLTNENKHLWLRLIQSLDFFAKVKLVTMMAQMSPTLYTRSHFHLLWRLVQPNVQYDQTSPSISYGNWVEGQCH